MDQNKINLVVIKQDYDNFHYEKTLFDSSNKSVFCTSYIKNCNDISVKKMSSNLENCYNQIENTYNKLLEWWKKYIEDVTRVENGIVTDSTYIPTNESSIDSYFKTHLEPLEKYNKDEIVEFTIDGMRTATTITQTNNSSTHSNFSSISNKKTVGNPINTSSGTSNTSSNKNSSLFSPTGISLSNTMKLRVNKAYEDYKSIPGDIKQSISFQNYISTTKEIKEMESADPDYGIRDYSTLTKEQKTLKMYEDYKKMPIEVQNAIPFNNYEALGNEVRKMLVGTEYENIDDATINSVIPSYILYYVYDDKIKEAGHSTKTLIKNAINQEIRGDDSYSMTCEFISDLDLSFSEWNAKILGELAATGGTMILGGTEGVVNTLENISDAVVMAGAFVCDFTGYGVNMLSGNTDVEFGSTMNKAKELVEVDVSKTAFDAIYNDTAIGSAIKENTNNFDNIRAISNQIGEVVTTVAIGAVAPVSVATVAGVSGFGGGLERAYNSGATTSEGVIYGVANGLTNYTAYYVGGKINNFTPFKTKLPDGTFTISNGQAIANSATRVALDTIDGFAESFFSPATSLIYEKGYIDENGEYQEYTGSFAEKYTQSFEAQGGWNSVLTQTIMAGGLSSLGEISGLAQKLSTDGTKKVNPSKNIVDTDTDRIFFDEERIKDGYGYLNSNNAKNLGQIETLKTDINNLDNGIKTILDKEVDTERIFLDEERIKMESDLNTKVDVDINAKNIDVNIKNTIDNNEGVKVDALSKLEEQLKKDMDEYNRLIDIKKSEKYQMYLENSTKGYAGPLGSDGVDFITLDEKLKQLNSNIYKNSSLLDTLRNDNNGPISLDDLKYSDANNKKYNYNLIESNFRKFKYINTNYIPDLNKTIFENGLYHFTSENGANAILNSGYVKSSDWFKSYGKQKSFFFAGAPSVGAFATNLDNLPLKSVAVKIQPDISIIDSPNLKVRYLDDNAITWDGKFNFKESTASKEYFCLFKDGDELVYKNVTKDFYDSYDNTIQGKQMADFINNKNNIKTIKSDYYAKLEEMYMGPLSKLKNTTIDKIKQNSAKFKNKIENLSKKDDNSKLVSNDNNISDFTTFRNLKNTVNELENKFSIMDSEYKSLYARQIGDNVEEALEYSKYLESYKKGNTLIYIEKYHKLSQKFTELETLSVDINLTKAKLNKLNDLLNDKIDEMVLIANSYALSNRGCVFEFDSIADIPSNFWNKFEHPELVRLNVKGDIIPLDSLNYRSTIENSTSIIDDLNEVLSLKQSGKLANELSDEDLIDIFQIEQMRDSIKIENFMLNIDDDALLVKQFELKQLIDQRNAFMYECENLSDLNPLTLAISQKKLEIEKMWVDELYYTGKIVLSKERQDLSKIDTWLMFSNDMSTNEFNIYKIKELPSLLKQEFSEYIDDKKIASLASKTIISVDDNQFKLFGVNAKAMGFNCKFGSVLNNKYVDYRYATAIHESIHALSNNGQYSGLHFYPIESTRGFNEAITEYLTKKIRPESISGYDTAVSMLQKLIYNNILDDHLIKTAYFNNDITIVANKLNDIMGENITSKFTELFDDVAHHRSSESITQLSELINNLIKKNGGG